MTTRLVHIAEVDLSPATGMGRVGWHWREGAIARGIPFVHIGPGDVPAFSHPREFPAAALRAWQQMRQPGDCLLVHEPASGAFIDQGAPVYVVSHGLERRSWQMQPLALLQAMATGRCCVTTDCCGQRDVITHGENGFLFAPGDATALTEHLARCADDPAVRHQLGAHARTSVAGRTWTAAFDQVWELISR